MTYYRLYFMAGAHVVNADGFEADDDREAIRQAEQQADRYSVELWRGRRKMGLFQSAPPAPAQVKEPAEA